MAVIQQKLKIPMPMHGVKYISKTWAGYAKTMTPAANAANNLASVKTLKKNASSLKKNNTKVNNTKDEKKQTIQPTATTVPTASGQQKIKAQ